MKVYPYSSPIIMTDEIFSQYGGNTGTASVALRQIAYQIAESAVYYDLDTPLQLTTFTGVFVYDSSQIVLDHAYVNRVLLTQYLDDNDDVYHSVTGTGNDWVRMIDADLGVLEISPYPYLSCQSRFRSNPFKVSVVYVAGLSSGTSYDPRILLALTSYSKVQINEMIGYGNEGPGDVGITEFKALEYSEKRMPMLRTGYGNSSIAQYIHKLLGPYRQRRYVRW